MKIFGVELFRSKPKATEKAYSVVNARSGVGGWLTVIGEAFGGAWQALNTVVADREQDVLAFSGVFACVTQIAGDISKMRMKLVVEGADGICTEVPPDKNSPYRAVLERPNHFQNRIKFLQQWIASKLIWGNVYVLKERDQRGIVVRLYILDPQRVSVLVTSDGGVYYQLSGDDLAGVAQSITVPASEIIHDLMVPLWHPLVGVSPIYACGLSATMGNRIQKNSTLFFQNASLPAGILTAPGKIEDADAVEMKRRWDENYGGNNRGKVAVLGNGLKFEPMGAIPANDAQLIEQLKWTVEDVARCFHVPVFKVGRPDPAEPHRRRAEPDLLLRVPAGAHRGDGARLEEGLALPGDVLVEFDLDALLAHGPAAMADFEEKLVGCGIKAPNESRRRFNLHPVKGGDSPMAQQQNFSLEALAKRDAREDPFGTAKPAALPAPPAANDPAAEARAVAGFMEAVTKGFESQEVPA
jgi:HK97 family phage portal protein